MEKISVTREIPKAAHDVADKLADFGLAVKKALDDGFQVGSDLPVIISAAISDLVPALQAIGGVKEAVKEDAFGTAEAFAHAGQKFVKGL